MSFTVLMFPSRNGDKRKRVKTGKGTLEGAAARGGQIRGLIRVPDFDGVTEYFLSG